MINNKVNIAENYLERKPLRFVEIEWNTSDDGIVTLKFENKGMFNRIAQKLFKKPKTTYIHLDKIGSFLWPVLNGESNIIELGKLVDEQFGEEAHPLYERLAKYFQILDSYHFISWND